MTEFSLKGRPHVELCDLLKLVGLCETGGIAKNFIAAGEVKVDNAVELRKRAKIVAGKVVEFNRQKVTVVP